FNDTKIVDGRQFRAAKRSRKPEPRQAGIVQRARNFGWKIRAASQRILMRCDQRAKRFGRSDESVRDLFGAFCKHSRHSFSRESVWAFLKRTADTAGLFHDDVGDIAVVIALY
ncbi:MAG TPA: hypothetical protein VGL08_02295, partial [Paraburkholderia sp.]